MPRSRAIDNDGLVNAAAQVFESKGYHNTTIDDIAEAAGISRPTIYKYTQSKRALLDGVVDTVLDRVSARLRTVLDSEEEPAEKMRRLIDIHVESATAMHTFYVILFSEQVELSDAARTRFHAFSHAVAVDFQSLLEQCVPSGSSKEAPDTWIAANLILSMLTSLYRWYDPAGSTDPKELGRQILLVLGAILPQKSPRRRAAKVS